MAKVVISIVTWNSMHVLPEALDSIAAQTHKDRSLIIVDNASDDDVVAHVRERHPDAVILRNSKNLGFARAHNQAIAYAKAHFARPGEDCFMLVTNPDIILAPDHVAQLVDAVARRPEVGSAGGKLCKAVSAGEGVLRHAERTATIDTTGIRMLKSRRIVERGAGEADRPGAFDRTGEVFGVSAAIALYRLSALQDVAFDGQEFDQDFFAYKEDIDLAWRLRLRGWSSLYVPAALAWHYRTAAGREGAGIAETVRGRRGRSGLVNALSYRNHLLLLLKNEQAANFLLHGLRIAWYELTKFLYLCVAEPRTVLAIGGVFRALPRTFAKRRAIMRGAKATAKQMRKWFA